MRQIVKAERIGDFGNIPVGLFKKDLRFLDHSGRDNICGCAAQALL